MKKELLDKKGVMEYIQSVIKGILNNSHIYTITSERSVIDRGLTKTVDDYFNTTIKRRQETRTTRKLDLYTEMEIADAKKLFVKYWNFYMDKYLNAKIEFETKYANIVNECIEKAKSVPWSSDEFPCGSAVVYFDHKSEIGSLLCVTKELSMPSHWSGKIFACSIGVPSEGQSMSMYEKRAQAMVDYFKTKGLEAKVYSWID